MWAEPRKSDGTVVFTPEISPVFLLFPFDLIQLNNEYLSIHHGLWGYAIRNCARWQLAVN
jgi:hypothetical protein